MSQATVVVGMSGGVDSSVAALLLKQQGYRVIGLYMKNWEEEAFNGACTSAEDYEDVVRVCDQLAIPHYPVNFVKQYWDDVFAYTLAGFSKGLTPNPDILCNREIKFKALLEKALELGADYLATGHYSQIGRVEEEYQLLKGSDPGKDQSYFLYTLRSSILKKVLFPVGGLEKSQVRSIARQYKLANAEKQDSTGICFIGERPFKSFLSTYIPHSRGSFEDLSGKTLGIHDGIAFYTLGQRRGLGIGGAGEPWFVVKKDIERNSVILAQGVHHPALYADTLTASELSWVGGASPPLPFACKAKIRYRQSDQECILTKIEDGVAHVVFERPQRAITPMQSIVFYLGECCMGGGMINASGPSYYEQGVPLLESSLEPVFTP